jgi:hypothetical protein
MKGHIRQRPSGRFAIVLETRDPATGKRRRKWHSFIFFMISFARALCRGVGVVGALGVAHPSARARAIRQFPASSSFHGVRVAH